MTTWIYDDKVSMISSSREHLGMIIESAEFAQDDDEPFTVLWAASTPDAGQLGTGRVENQGPRERARTEKVGR